MLTLKVQYAFSRPLNIILIAMTCLSVFASTAAAQEPELFEISLQTESEYAIPGQPFTYVITVTNTGQEPVQNVLVTVGTPKGTTYKDSDVIAEQRWLIGGFSPGKAGEIFWLTQESLAPSSTAIFKLIVNVLPETREPLLVEGHFVTTLDDYQEATVNGLPLETEVLAPTPTPSPAVAVPATPQSMLKTKNKSPSPTPAVIATVDFNNNAEHLISDTEPDDSPQQSILTTWFGISGWVLGLVFVSALGWFILKQ